jgi:hypothetical protein
MSKLPEEGEKTMTEEIIRSDSFLKWRSIFIAHAKAQTKVDLVFNNIQLNQKAVTIKLVGASYFILEDETCIQLSQVVGIRPSKLKGEY